ncbi:pirin family protein [Sphingobium sp. EM0848]|uniref:pirin family protein n=1 Tax=Sphingobium sp. EM0848 TaxID=2743473 RepID=UPI00159C5869|nr:pirin family protein [Sphingobium sp. EM0848]
MMTTTQVAINVANRPIMHRTRGHKHGMITRLMSPGDLGGLLKPFVFLDLFDNDDRPFTGFGLHPHSGIATLTYIAEGSVFYEDTNGATGILRSGGVEWMRAGKGVWHGGGAGDPERTRGFQLWVALPPELELGASESVYQSATDIPQVGPAKVLLGTYVGMSNEIDPPSPISYLAVSLRAGERWRYVPAPGHTILWAALGRGRVNVPAPVEQGEMIIFAPGEEAVEFVAEEDAEFVIGSAVPHQHDLILGYYSVHTNAAALRAGEARIREIRAELQRQGRL